MRTNGELSSDRRIKRSDAVFSLPLSHGETTTEIPSLHTSGSSMEFGVGVSRGGGARPRTSAQPERSHGEQSRTLRKGVCRG